MSDELLPETPPPATTPPAAPAQQPSANPLDLPEVRAAIASASSAAAEQARNATWKQARETLGKKTNGTAPTPEPQPTQPPAAPSPTAGLTAHDILRVSAFTAAATEHGVPPRGVEMLLERVMTEKPADVRAWVATEAASFGWSKPTPTTSASTPAAPQAATQASGPPVTSNGAPSSAGRVTDDVPLIDRSPADQDAFRKQHGLIAFTDRLLKEARENKTRLRLPR